MPNRPHLHSRRATWLVLLLAMIYSPMEQSAAQCDKCTDAIISLYDASVLVPRPDDAESIIKWRLLFWVSAVARNWNHTQDPTRECFTWIDGGVVTAPASKVVALVRDAVAGSLEKFCGDYAPARAYWLARQRARLGDTGLPASAAPHVEPSSTMYQAKR